MHYTYNTEMVCAQKIDFDLDNGIISNIQFVGGCNGNLKAISKLLDGKDINTFINILKGNTCGRRPTSCADQLVRAINLATKEE